MYENLTRHCIVNKWYMSLHRITLLVFSQTRPPFHPFNLGAGNSIFKGTKYISCGGPLAEAEALGCEYDILANHFVHPLCLDQGALSEYQQGDTWLGYTDMNWTDIIPITRAMVIAELIANEEHVMHRAQFLVDMSESHDGFDWREKPMTVEMGYAGCVNRGM
jgi:hypothetical protein